MIWFIIIIIALLFLVNVEKFTNIIGVTSPNSLAKYSDIEGAMKSCSKCFNCGVCQTTDNDYLCLEGDFNAPYSYGRWNYLSEYETTMDKDKSDDEIQGINDIVCKKWLYNSLAPFSSFPSPDSASIRMTQNLL